MKRLVAVGVSVVFGVATLVSSASAATEFGDTCAGNLAAGPYTLTTLSAPAASLPLTAPISGVITQVKVLVALEGLPPTLQFPEQVKVLRATGAKNTYTVTGQTPIEVHNGLNVASARIPVQVGDRLGIDGLPFVYEGSPNMGVAIYCAGPTIDGTLGAVLSEAPEGSTTEFAEVTEGRVPVAAVIEPDADGDGYGDETQDKCPQSAAYQTACPVVTIGSFPTVGKKAVTLRVATSLSAPVSVTATVPLGKGKTATLTAAAQTVVPGNLAPFTLTLTPQVTKALKALPTKKSLTLSITASATNVTGAPSASTSTVKLKGQAKPVHKKKPKQK